MARPITEQSKLPSASMPWARQVSDTLNNLTNKVSNFIADQTNKNRANNSNIQALSTQSQVLAAQQQALQAQANSLAQLITVSAEGVTFDTPEVPADQTFRYYQSSPSLSVKLRCATGRLLLQYGSGECRVNPYGMIVAASVTFQLSTASGWSYTPDTARARTTVYDTALHAVPLAASTTVDGIPTDEDVTVVVRYGIWGGNGATLTGGAAHYTSNYLVAQVIPAV